MVSATSPVTPNPAAEFSTLAITRSSRSRSQSGGIARRTMSRPDLPKMSPMKRMRMLLRGNGDAQLAPAAFLDARQDDAQFAGRERGRRAPGVARDVHPHV